MSNKTAPPPDNDDLINPKVAVSCLDFLLIELVPLAQRLTDQLHAREQALIDDFKNSKIFNGKANDTNASDSKPAPSNSTAPAIKVTEGTGPSVKGSEVSTTAGDGRSSAGNAPTGLDDETREAMFWRLDGLGYRVGQGLAERFSVGKSRPQTPLDAIKFICKDLWTLLFRKQIDNLKTNHRGVFVLTDSRFQPLSRMSVDRRAGSKAGEEALRKAQTVSLVRRSCSISL